MSLIAPTLQLFFTERLIKQRQGSPATVRSYRSALTLLLRFVQERTGKAPSVLEWDDLGQVQRAPWKGAVSQRVRNPPGNCRSSRKQSERSEEVTNWTEALR